MASSEQNQTHLENSASSKEEPNNDTEACDVTTDSNCIKDDKEPDTSHQDKEQSDKDDDVAEQPAEKTFNEQNTAKQGQEAGKIEENMKVDEELMADLKDKDNQTENVGQEKSLANLTVPSSLVDNRSDIEATETKDAEGSKIENLKEILTNVNSTSKNENIQETSTEMDTSDEKPTVTQQTKQIAETEMKTLDNHGDMSKNKNPFENESGSVIISGKDTCSVSGVSGDRQSMIDMNGSVNNDVDAMNISTRATYGDSSFDNMSVSGASESKSGGFEKRFSVESMETDDRDMNMIREERLEQYLESMRSVNQTTRNVEEAQSVKERKEPVNIVNFENEDTSKIKESIASDAGKDPVQTEPSKSANLQEITENVSKETAGGHENSDKSTESSNGEKSQTDIEVARIMKKGIEMEKAKSAGAEQNENTSIPDVEVDPKSEKDIWKMETETYNAKVKVQEENGEKNEEKITKEVTGLDKCENKLDKNTDEIKTTKEAVKDTPDAETDFAFVKLPVSSKAKKDTEQPREILKRKMFDEFTEDSSNSSWYKIKDKPVEEPMDTDDKTGRLLVTDEGSNLSIPDDSSLVSASAMEDSRLSFTDQVSNMDELSNLSAGDSCSVKAFGHELVLDESANLNPPDKDLFVQPSTPSSVVTDATSEATPVKRYRRGTLAMAVEEASEHGHNIKAKDLFEYQWPQESGADWFMLQEQISAFLEVKSFKRKYPDLFRRVCDKLEKDFLREKGVVSETQSDLGLTALKSEEVHELLGKDYPSKYREYCAVLHEKEKQIMVNKQKDYVLPKLEKSKMREYTMKAMKSASEWNRQFLKERKEERRAYFDMQTFTIQYPKSRYRKVENIKTVPASYPVSLIPGQFQEYSRKYTAEELKYFPLNTALLNPPKEQKPGSQDEQVTENQIKEVDNTQPVKEENSNWEENEEENQAEKEKSISRETSAEKQPEAVPVKNEDSLSCWVCVEEEKQGKTKSKRKNSKTDEEFISCSECKKQGHASCLDLTDSMLKVIKTYPWQCMECKTCVECMNSTDEDKMLFCDHCDRGYHTFCVGLKSLPMGKWLCVSCGGDTTPVKQPPKQQPKTGTKRRGRPPKNPEAKKLES